MKEMEMYDRIVKLINRYAPEGTRFEWDRAERRFGSCRYKRNRVTGEFYDFRITVSYPIASRNEWSVIERTVLHEIAHARAPGHGHDYVWQRECLLLGGDGKRCFSDTNHDGDVKVPPKKFVGTCPVCGTTFLRSRRTRCYHCNRNYPLVWTLNKEVA